MILFNYKLLFFLIHCLAFCKSQGNEPPPGCEVVTTSGYRYSKFWHIPTKPTGGHELRFRVRGRSDAHVVLSTSPILGNPLYEIVLGASNNNYTDLRRSSMGKSVLAVPTPNIISDKEYRGFWISVNPEQGEIEIGRETEVNPFFYWKDPEPLQVHYYSFSMWTGTIGKWTHQCDFPGSSSWFTVRGTVSNSSGELTPGIRPGDEIIFFNAIEKLRYNLLHVAQYNKEVRPSSTHTENVTIAMSLTVHHIDLDELAGVFTINAWMLFSWRDDRLKWNASDYDGLGILHIPAQVVWLPDIVLYNNAEANNVNHYGEVNVLVYPDGSVMWVPPITLHSRCQIDLRNWPYDEQTCRLKFGSWSHDGSKVGVDLSKTASSAISFDSYAPNLRWNITKAEASAQVDYYACCEEPYPSVYFNFTIQRQSPSFRSSIIAPAIVLVLLNMSVFLLPLFSLQRIITGLISFLVVCVYVLYFSLILPAMGDHMPSIVMFYGDMAVLFGISIIISVVQMTLANQAQGCRLPTFIRNVLTGTVGDILCLGHDTITKKHNRLGLETDPRSAQWTSSVDAIVDTEIKASENIPDAIHGGVNAEWYLLAKAIDRIAFLLFGIIYAVQAMLCF